LRIITGFRYLLAAVALTVIVLPCIGVAWLLAPVMTDPVPGFVARKGELQSVEVTLRRQLDDGVLTEVTLHSSSGLTVQLALRQPLRPLPSRPILLLIAGQETGRDAVMVFPETHGVAVAALSYFYQGGGGFSRLGLAMNLHKVQQAILDTAPAVMLANDYLLAHAGLDSDNLELAGVSFGAFLAAAPAVLDPRVRRLWLIHGAGDPAAVLEHSLENKIPLAPLRALVARFLATIAGSEYLSSHIWVGRIPPRPVVVVNGRADDDLPVTAVRALHDALGDSGEIIWTEGGHIHPKRPETIIAVIDIMLQRIVQEAAPVP
jgi:pimeloyl-ACP methyl ester carboxylesterase